MAYEDIPTERQRNPYRIIRETDGIRHVTRIQYDNTTAIVSMWWKSSPNKPAKREYFDNLDEARRFADDCDHQAWKVDARVAFSY